MKKKISKILAGGIIIMTFGWIGGLFFGRYLTPVLIKSDIFSKMGIFDDDNRNTTIINKTEKVVVREDDSIAEVSSNAIYSVVEILSFSKSSLEKNKASLASSSSQYNGGKRGAGTILTNDGVVVTYRTNIQEENADYKAIAFGGNVLDATLLGVDEFTNLAFLKVEGINLNTIPFADSDNIGYGKRVIAIGNLLGNGKIALTSGILSSIDERFNLSGTEIASSEKLEGVFRMGFNNDENYIGGPIINYSGELVAISAMMNVDNQEIFFQIPVNAIKDSIQRVVEKRLEQAAKLGIYYISVDPFYKNLKSLSVDKGALIYSATGKQGLAIVAGSVAEKSGLKIGDVILSIDGNEINLSQPLSNLINQYEKGNSAVLNVLRDGQEIEVTVEF